MLKIIIGSWYTVSLSLLTNNSVTGGDSPQYISYGISAWGIIKSALIIEIAVGFMNTRAIDHAH